MDIAKAKDNNYFKGEYVDSEILRDNFDGSEEMLKVIAQTVYDCVDGDGGDDDTFMDRCQSMICYDYDYLNKGEQDKVEDLVNYLVENNGEFVE